MSTADVRPVLRKGCLAYYDSLAGLLPCKVLSVTGKPGAPSSESEAIVKLTANRGPWKRGEVLAAMWTIHVVPRKAVSRRGPFVRVAYYAVEAS